MQLSPPAAVTAAAGAGRGALLGAIQGGAKLRKAVTNDRSTAAVSGSVVGDAAPPPHISTVARDHSPPPVQSPPMDSTGDSAPGHNHRQSVDWFAGRAADHGTVHPMPPHSEASEDGAEVVEPMPPPPPASIPDIQVHEPAQEAVSVEPHDGIDRSIGK